MDGSRFDTFFIQLYLVWLGFILEMLHMSFHVSKYPSTKTAKDLLYKPPFNLYLDFTKVLGLVFPLISPETHYQ